MDRRTRHAPRARSGSTSRGVLLLIAWLVATCILAIACPARAQGPRPGPSPRYAPPPPGLEPAETRSGIQLGATLRVPSFVGDQADITSTGVGLGGDIGYDLGYVVPQLRIGWQWHAIDVGRRIDESLNRMAFAIGAKFEGENDSIVTPFGSFAFDLNWWTLSFEDRVICDPHLCVEENTYRFSPGFTTRGGIAIALGDSVTIDIGAELGVSFEGNVFVDEELWMGPLFGVTGHLR